MAKTPMPSMVIVALAKFQLQFGAFKIDPFLVVSCESAAFSKSYLKITKLVSDIFLPVTINQWTKNSVKVQCHHFN